MTPDLARLREDERAIVQKSQRHPVVYDMDVELLAVRLDQARAERDFHEREERERNQQARSLQQKLARARAVVEELRDGLKRISADVEEVARLPEIQAGERRAWKAVSAQLKALVAHDAEAWR